MHFIGLFYTSDFNYAFKDIRIKAPLLILPLIISTTKPLSRKLFDTILQLFVAAIIIGTIISSLILIDIIHRNIIDIRDISIFISHIRFALLICVAIFISSYFIFNSLTISGKAIWSAIIIWLVFFLIVMESLTGLAALTITLFILIIYTILKSKNKNLKYGALVLLCGSITLLALYINSIAKENQNQDFIDYNRLDTYTSHGNLYEHDKHSKITENGHLIWMYYCNKELEQSWNNRSPIKIDSNNWNGNTVYYSIIRFLASKGLRKDADAVNSNMVLPI